MVPGIKNKSDVDTAPTSAVILLTIGFDLVPGEFEIVTDEDDNPEACCAV